MKISFIFNSFSGGGKERRCLQLIQGLNKVGIKDIQFIIINNQVDYPELYNTSAKVHIMNRKASGMSHLQTIICLRRLICKHSPDIVMAWGLMAAFYVNFVRLTKRFKYIGAYVANCNKPSGMKMFANKLCILLSDKIVGNSTTGLRTYGIPQKKRICIYNGYNKFRLNKLDKSAKAEKKKELGIKTSYVVTMAARVDENKDYDSFLKVADYICKERNDITFLALGKGALLEYYKCLAAEKYNNNVVFLGFRNDIDDVLEITNVSCLFTEMNRHVEGVSNSILESMAHGVPVIATNAGGSPEIIDDGQNGYLIDGNDVEKSVSIINSLINDKEKRLMFSEKAKSTVTKKFNLENKTEEYLQLFESLINDKDIK